MMRDDYIEKDGYRYYPAIAFEIDSFIGWCNKAGYSGVYSGKAQLVFVYMRYIGKDGVLREAQFCFPTDGDFVYITQCEAMFLQFMSQEFVKKEEDKE